MRRIVLAFGFCTAACASTSHADTQPPDATATGGEIADGAHLTEFQTRRLLGHYSTRDGTSGFILDRTVDPPLVKLDGAPQIRSLNREGSVTGTYVLRSADREVWLRIDDASGDVRLFDGPAQTQGVDVVRDADARRLKQ